ncbi:tryptophan halogenase family protein [Neptunicella sp. SCSIO 80796]|uniref:tryptophan halogenase family protein n=1 Tax=Neptunicella plasticusilytica TaxID=3117012 RepID=UPI003A4D75EF
MQTEAIRHIVIVGGGSAGWMAAAALANRIPSEFCQITLVESDAIGTVGVGESTIPHIQQFNAELGIDEQDFIRQTRATIKLGIQFNDWANLGDSYMHPFSETGHVTQGIDFHHYWLKSRTMGDNSRLDEYSLAAMAGKARRFAPPVAKKESLLSAYTYSYHIDATAYARYLRDYAEKRGVKRVEGKIIEVQQHAQSGFIETVVLENGHKIGGELFVDCSGFAGLLIDKKLQSRFIDWSHWLATDSAAVVPCERNQPLNPYTIATARDAGWQWQIPLQHRMGNGHVFSSSHMSEQTALDTLMQTIPGQPTAEPRILRFKAGRREQSWCKNCVAIGLSSGFLEPLESTSIFLIQMGILKLLEFFPSKDFPQAGIAQYNQSMSYFYDQIRNFIILHYHATSRSDTEFWNDCRTMSIPDDLQRLIRLFKQCGRVDRTQFGIWSAVCIGQGLIPEQYDARIDGVDYRQIQQYMANYRNQVQRAVNTLPPVEMFIQNVMQSAATENLA